MMGLEPTTFCMARNGRHGGGDRRRQRPPGREEPDLGGFGSTTAFAKYGEPSETGGRSRCRASLASGADSRRQRNLTGT